MIEIQRLTTGERGRWVMERRFGDHLSHSCPVSHIDLVWDQILTACPGSSWRMVQLLPGGGEIIHHGPTEPVPGAPVYLPLSPALSPLRFEQFGG